MAGVSHDPAFAKKVGIKQSVGREFNQADKGTGILSHEHGGTVEHRQLAKQAAAHAAHAKGTGQDYEAGGYVGGFGTSVAQAPPEGHRKQGPRLYGKKE
jgi:hypothetical protein